MKKKISLRPRDPLIEEVRAIRQELWAGWNHDLATGVGELRKLELRYQNRVVDFRKKTRAPKKG
jgi:hypothetical protein